MKYGTGKEDIKRIMGFLLIPLCAAETPQKLLRPLNNGAG